MQWLSHRTAPLSQCQQVAFLEHHVPGRISSIQDIMIFNREGLEFMRQLDFSLLEALLETVR